VFVSDNMKNGRNLIVTPRVYDKVHSPPLSRSPHGPPDMMRFSDDVKSIRPGTPYVLAVLRPDPEYPLNTVALSHAWKALTTATAEPGVRQYVVSAGRVGDRPELVVSDDLPYRVRLRIEPYDIDIRMESWLPTDTIRRAGFGHVIVNRRHALTLERGISFIALGPSGKPVYDSGLFAPIPKLNLTLLMPQTSALPHQPSALSSMP
jgi:hypothetical protein